MELNIFVHEPNKDTICPRCSKVFTFPCCCSRGHTYCVHCVNGKVPVPCPVCVEGGLMPTVEWEMNATLWDSIQSLEVFCEHESWGCQWTGELQHRGSHKINCEYSPIPCEHQDCNERFISRDLREHQETCPFRRVPCDIDPRCRIKPLLKDLPAHRDVCTHMPVTCELCKRSDILRAALELHRRDNCLATLVLCEHADCGVEVVRSALKVHQAACLHRRVKCTACNEHIAFLRMETHQLKECPCRVLTCGQNGCDASVAAQDLAAHRETCTSRARQAVADDVESSERAGPQGCKSTAQEPSPGHANLGQCFDSSTALAVVCGGLTASNEENRPTRQDVPGASATKEPVTGDGSSDAESSYGDNWEIDSDADLTSERVAYCGDTWESTSDPGDADETTPASREPVRVQVPQQPASTPASREPVRVQAPQQPASTAASREPVQCSNDGCNELIESRFLTFHRLLCPFRTSYCTYSGCPEQHVHCLMQEHLSGCPYRRVVCENKGCGDEVAFRDMAVHQELCSFRPARTAATDEQLTIPFHRVQQNVAATASLANPAGVCVR